MASTDDPSHWSRRNSPLVISCDGEGRPVVCAGVSRQIEGRDRRELSDALVIHACEFDQSRRLRSESDLPPSDAANPERCSAGDGAIYFAGLPHEDATQKPERSSDCARAPEAPPATTTPRSRPDDPCDSLSQGWRPRSAAVGGGSGRQARTRRSARAEHCGRPELRRHLCPVRPLPVLAAERARRRGGRGRRGGRSPG